MKPKVYLETTIISYCTSRPSRDLIVAAHQQINQEWWDTRRIDFDLFVSELVIQESSAGDQEAVQRRSQFLEGIPLLEINQDAVTLARELISRGAFPEKAAGDALHLAIATTNGIDYLLTWNLKHLANAVLRNAMIDICLDLGYETPVICTPEELLEVE
jgi:predicted nucleic acid-binding protein